MNTNNQSEIVRKMDKQALRTFGLLALAAYSCALAYCYFTDHLFETEVVGAIMLGLVILIANVYASMGVKSNKHEG